MPSTSGKNLRSFLVGNCNRIETAEGVFLGELELAEIDLHASADIACRVVYGLKVALGTAGGRVRTDVLIQIGQLCDAGARLPVSVHEQVNGQVWQLAPRVSIP